MKKFSQLFAAVATAALVAPPYALAELPSVQHSHASSSENEGRFAVDRQAYAQLAARFVDVNVARAEGWIARAPHVVSGPNPGAMGVHFFC